MRLPLLISIVVVMFKLRRRRALILAGITAFVLALIVWVDPWRVAAEIRDELSGVSTGPVAVSNVCGTSRPAPKQYEHVIWIMEENQPLSHVIGYKYAPFLTSLSKECAYSTNFSDNEPRSLFTPGYHSLSHYVATLSGSNCMSGNNRNGSSCITNDHIGPTKQSLSSMSLFQQVSEAGRQWRSYQESAPSSCSLTGKKPYTPRHDGALFFSAIRNQCRSWDVPIPAYNHYEDAPTGPLAEAIRNDKLPAFSYITPNLNHDMHDGSVKAGDGWLKSYLELLFTSPEYRSGKTAVFVIWDEAPRKGQPLPNLVIAPSVHGGAVKVDANGFGVLGTTEALLGLSKLGCASGLPPGGTGQCYTGATADLRGSFGL